MDDKIKALYDTALEHYRNNFLDLSIKEFKTVLTAEPKNVPARIQLCQALEKKGTVDQERAFYILALNEAKLALKMSTGLNKQLHQQMINLYDKCGQLDIAIREYKKMLQDEPDNAFYQECLKQIMAISALKVIPVASEEKIGRSKLIMWILIVFVGGEILLGIFIKNKVHIFIGAAILVIYLIYRALDYLQSKPDKW